MVQATPRLDYQLTFCVNDVVEEPSCTLIFTLSLHEAKGTTDAIAIQFASYTSQSNVSICSVRSLQALPREAFGSARR